MEEPRIYKIDRKKYQAAHRKSGIQTLITTAILSVIFGFIFPNTTISEWIYICQPCTIGDRIYISIILFLVIIILPGSIVIYLRGRHVKRIDDYELELANNYFIWRQPEAKDFRVNKNEIIRLNSNINGIFVIVESNEMISISPHLHKFIEIRSILETWVENPPISKVTVLKDIARILSIVTLFVFYLLTKNPIAIIIIGIVIIVYLIRNAIKLWNRETTIKTTRIFGVLVYIYFTIMLAFKFMITLILIITCICFLSQ